MPSAFLVHRIILSYQSSKLCPPWLITAVQTFCPASANILKYSASISKCSSLHRLMIPFYRNTVLPKVEMELPIFRCGDYVVEYFYGQRQYLVFTRSRTNKYLSRIFSRRYVSRNLYCNPYRSSGSSRYRHLGDIIENIGHEVAVFCFMRRSSGTSQYFV